MDSAEAESTPLDGPIRPRWRDLFHLPWIRAVLVVELLVATAVVFGLWTLRQQTLSSELRMLASLSAAMAAQADGTLDVADAALRATADELASGLLLPAGAGAHTLLHARVASLPRFRALSIFDEKGVRVASSRDEAAPAVSIADRDFFKAAREAAVPALYVGSPYVSRTDGRALIGVSMGRRDAAGQFRGAVALAADPEFLDGSFEQIAPTPDTSLAIYRRDRELVSDGPGDGSARLLPAGIMASIWGDAGPTRPRVVVLPDGGTRLVAAHPLQRYALMVVITRDAGSALAGWTDLAWLVGSFAASALAVTLALTLRNGREQALRRASEAALAAEQQRAVRAFQAAQEGHWEWSPKSGQTQLSDRMKELLGVERMAPAQGAPLDPPMLHPDDREPLRAAFLAHQQGRAPAFDSTFRVRRADGRWRHVRARGHAWRDSKGELLLFSGTAADVTEEVEGRERRRQLEEQVQRSSKLEALGTLAGGVAHDFNNILASVIGYGELARRNAQAGSAQARQLDQVLQAGQRGKALVERILSFSRGTPRPHSAFLIAPVIEEVLQLLSASLPAGVKLVPQLHADDAVIVGDPTMVYEAAMNLCTNGMQAMPQGGDLFVDLSVVRVDEPRIFFETTLGPGRYACLAVTDGGSGIAPEVMSRLFEPFFTTRGPDKGTGLGLAVVHGVVADLGGAIDVQSELGKGARFTLYFPCTDRVPEAAVSPDGELPLGNGQRVLVVDDEPALVELAEELLAGLGYEPFGVVSSVQALERFKEDVQRFDLVLSDEVMPDMTGTLLAAALHEVRPGLPIVIASGYGGPQLELRAANAGVTVLVKKPLARAELAQAVARALRHPPGLQT